MLPHVGCHLGVKMFKLEVCCFSVDCALTAERAGADRIELCASQSEDGLTPSLGTLSWVRDRVTIPVHPIVRPRGGDFCYSAVDFEVIKRDIARVRDMGFPGVVVGMLDDAGHIDLPRMREVMLLGGDMAITFHRAFDLCQNPLVALEQLTQLGVARILTSGQQQSAELGLPLLRDLLDASQGPVIMAGAGVRMSNLHKFVDIGIQELHSSAGHWVPSTLRYRKAGVTLCSDNAFDEFSHYCVDADMVEAMKSALVLRSLG